MAGSSSEERGFEAALEAISSLITRRKRADGSNWGDAFALMDTYIKILDLEEPLSRLSVIHVAGTKGKGSTCAFAESILRHSGNKTGMFTSPHLVDVRERFRIRGELVPKDVFLEHFWWCWDRFQAAATPDVPLPAYFRFLTLLALRIFIAEKVDVALLEVGIGGRYDATNVVRAPVVCGVASLGYDHTELLGDTLPLIAAEKAGIFKPRVPAITAPQPDDAMEALQKRADELQISLDVAPPLESLEDPSAISLGLAGDHQRINAALAVALCRAWTERAGPTAQLDNLRQAMQRKRLPDSFRRGLASVEWPGRAQIMPDTEIQAPGESPQGSLMFYLDGAHTPESMEVCATWFCESVAGGAETAETSEGGQKVGHQDPPEGSGEAAERPGLQNGLGLAADLERVNGEERDGRTDRTGLGSEGLNVRRVLLFNCMQEREPVKLLDPLIRIAHGKGVSFHRAIFVPSFSSSTSITTLSSTPDLTWQQTQLQTWTSILHKLGPTLNRKPNPVPPTAPAGAAEQPDRNGSHVASARDGDVSWDGSGFVMPSLPAALEWLRKAAREQPPGRLQVLVSGSLHLVGDVLRLLKH
ncbi:folylpolyglutamate synthase [Klebsormidium nitens]|uniref:Folylpolyglutamate synthase n=1 Tax=Klebsormidium nitens TaxID=105231 RepID=A0A1Y1I3F7_KLENI|nr:folylpolyglutamate synthase [Klebsormidium nitens]|eukprot:GAQ83711.1 folylpolyglutamate synthase [Klebsormidium nitens]